jgi:tetratricopeptide (TPR) repeat protein
VVDLITGGERRPTVPEIPIVTAARPSIPPQPSLPVSPPEEHLSWEESFLDRARMAVDAGNLDQAIEFLSQAIKLKPGAIKPRIELARLCEKRGSFDLAAEEWRQILTIEPHHFDARQQLIVCYNQLNRFDEAIALVEESLRDASWKDNSDLFRALAMAYYKTGRLNEALWALGRAQQLCSDPKQKARLAALKQIWEKESAKP